MAKFKVLSHLASLNLSQTDRLLGTKIDYGDVYLYTRPRDKTLADMFASIEKTEIAKLSMVALY